MRELTKKQGVGAREAARQLGTQHSYLLRLAKDGRLPRYADGTFDVENCRRTLAQITDPAQVRKDNPDRWSPGGHPAGHLVTSDQPGELRGVTLLAVEAAKQVGTEFEAGIVTTVVALAHRVGAIAALTALDEGATLPVAYGIEKAFTVYFIESAEGLLRDLPSFRGVPADDDLPTGYAPEFMDQIDWNVIARERGEIADVEAWAGQSLRAEPAQPDADSQHNQSSRQGDPRPVRGSRR